MDKFTYEINIPNSGVYIVESDRELTDAQAYQYALKQASPTVATNQQKPTQVPQPQKRLSGGEVLTGAVMNFPKSFGSMVGDVYEAVTSPVETIKSVLDIGAGTLQNLLPDKVVDFVGRDRASIDKANLVKQFYVNRYGNLENAKQALASDPASVLSDLSVFLTGGAGITPKASAASKVFSTAAALTDPLNIITKPVAYASKSVAPILGTTTGAGSMAIEEAYQAGKQGGVKAKSFTENLRGTADQLQVLEDTKSNLQAMIQEQQNLYRSGMVNIKADKSVLALDDIDTALQKANDRVYFEGVARSEDAAGYLKKANKIINDWRSKDPTKFRTPEALDALKQKIYDDVLSNIPINQKSSTGIIGDIYNSVKSTIQKQAPTYADTMKAYADTAEQVREIERALSQGKKASADAGLRKLQTVLRDNASTNYGQRVKLVNQLEATSPSLGGGIPIKPALAGQALSKVTPRGITAVGTLPAAVGVGSLFSSTPASAAYLAASSPRLVGEAAYLTGQGSRQLGKVTGLFPELDYPLMFNLLSKTQTE